MSISPRGYLEKAYASALVKLESRLNPTNDPSKSIDKLIIVELQEDIALAAYPQASMMLAFGPSQIRLTPDSAASNPQFSGLMGPYNGEDYQQREEKLQKYLESICIHETLHSVFFKRYQKDIAEVLGIVPETNIARNFRDQVIAEEISLDLENNFPRPLSVLIMKSAHKNLQKNGITYSHLESNAEINGINEAFAYSVNDHLTGLVTLNNQTADRYNEQEPGQGLFMRYFYSLFTNVINEHGLDFLLDNFVDIINRHKEVPYNIDQPIDLSPYQIRDINPIHISYHPKKGILKPEEIRNRIATENARNFRD